MSLFQSFVTRDRDSWATCVSFLACCEIGRLPRVHRELRRVTLVPRVWHHCTVDLAQDQVRHMPLAYRQLVRRLSIARWERRSVPLEGFTRLLAGFTQVDDLGVGQLTTQDLFAMISPREAEPAAETTTAASSGAYIRSIGFSGTFVAAPYLSHWRFSRVDHLVLHDGAAVENIVQDFTTFAASLLQSIRHLTLRCGAARWSAMLTTGAAASYSAGVQKLLTKLHRLERFECDRSAAVNFTLPTTVTQVALGLEQPFTLAQATAALAGLPALRRLTLNLQVLEGSVEEFWSLLLQSAPALSTCPHVVLTIHTRDQAMMHAILIRLRVHWPDGRVRGVSVLEGRFESLTFESERPASLAQSTAIQPKLTSTPDDFWSVLRSDVESLEVTLDSSQLDALLTRWEQHPLPRLVTLEMTIRSDVTPEQATRLTHHLATELPRLIHPLVRWRIDSDERQVRRNESISDVEQEEEEATNQGPSATAAAAARLPSRQSIMWSRRIAEACEPMSIEVDSLSSTSDSDSVDDEESLDRDDLEAHLPPMEDDPNGAAFMAILDEADVDADDYRRLSAVIDEVAQEDLFNFSRDHALLFQYSLHDFRRVALGHRVVGSREYREWKAILHQYENERDQADQNQAMYPDVYSSDPTYLRYLDQEECAEGERDASLQWTTEQVEEAERATGRQMRWKDLAAYLDQHVARSHATAIRAFLAADHQQTKSIAPPDGCVLDWLRFQEGESIEPTHQHVYELLLDTINTLADEQCEVHESLQDQCSASNVAFEQLMLHLEALIDHIEPRRPQATNTAGTKAAAPKEMTDTMQVDGEAEEEKGGELDQISTAEAAIASAADGSRPAAALAVNPMELDIDHLVESTRAIRLSVVASFQALHDELTATFKAMGQHGGDNKAAPAHGSESPDADAMQDDSSDATSISDAIASPSASSSSSSSSPVEHLELRLSSGRAFLSSAHQRVLSLLDGEDVPITAGPFWADCLRTIGVALEQSNSSEAVVPPRAFERLVREIASDHRMELAPAAVQYLQQAAEQYLTHQFDNAGARVDAVQALAQAASTSASAVVYAPSSLSSSAAYLPVNRESAFSHLSMMVEQPKRWGSWK